MFAQRRSHHAAPSLPRQAHGLNSFNLTTALEAACTVERRWTGIRTQAGLTAERAFSTPAL